MIYIVTFFTSALFLHLSEKYKYKIKKVFFLCIALLIPSLLAGFRDYSIGKDVLLYGNYWFKRALKYNSLIDYLMNANEYGIGIGYAFVNFICSRISPSPHFFYFVYELLQLILVYFALKPFRCKINISYAFLIYYFSYFNNSLNLLRQIMAIILMLVSYKYIVEKKRLKFIATILIAYSFHTSGIVGIVLYPISWAVENKALKQIARTCILIGSLTVVVAYEQLFNLLATIDLLNVDRYSHYLTGNEVGGRFMRLTYWGILLIIVFWRQNNCEKYAKNSTTLITYMTISAVFSIFTFIGLWIIRIAYYFDVFQVMLIPILAVNLGIKIGRLRKNTGYVLLLLFVFVDWFIIYILRNGGATYPYLFMTY